LIGKKEKFWGTPKKQRGFRKKLCRRFPALQKRRRTGGEREHGARDPSRETAFKGKKPEGKILRRGRMALQKTIPASHRMEGGTAV